MKKIINVEMEKIITDGRNYYLFNSQSLLKMTFIKNELVNLEQIEL